VLQLRRIRSFVKNGIDQNYDAPFNPDILVESAQELFKNLQSYLDFIPELERYNCHYTLGAAPGGKSRGKGTFLGQGLIPFDVDGIEWSEDKTETKQIVANFKQAFFETTGADKDKTLVVFSGNGLHFILQVKPWTDKEYFKNHAQNYDALCSALEAEFRDRGLAFKELDRAVFAPNHMLRLPGTINKKPNKIDRICKILAGNLSEQSFSWDNFATLGTKKSKATPTKEYANGGDVVYPKVDSSQIESGCRFLIHCKENPEKIGEAQWYASLSILSRLDSGKEKCHEYSKGHPHYSHESTTEKIEHALTSGSGPRTCKNINTLWEGCGECVYNGKIKTPLQIKSDAFIATEDAGFHTLDANGKLHPSVDDLHRFFAREKVYRTNSENGVVYTFNGKKYEIYHKQMLRGFAGVHWQPQPKEHFVAEFIHRANRVNNVPPKFFEGRENCINLDNGVLELATGNLREHSPEDGFMYVLPYGYEKGATCPEFDSMMQRITCNDAALEQLLLEFVGYIIFDRTYWLHKALILVGDGSNGKSTFLDIVKALVGRTNYSAIGIKEMEDHGKRAMLQGKLVNISDEMPNLRMSDTDTFKKMMGGNITIKNVYEKPTTIRCTTKLMFAANEIPSTYDNSHGLMRRLLLVPFDYRFDKNNKDRGLMDRLLKELPGIFNRVRLAYDVLKGRGSFIEASRSEQQLHMYKEDNDSVGSEVAGQVNWYAEWDTNPASFITFEAIQQAVAPVARAWETERVKKQVRAALKRCIPDLEKRAGREYISGKLMRGFYGLYLGPKKEAGASANLTFK